MKASQSITRSFVNVRLLATMVVILIAMFVTATALMKGLSEQRESNRAQVASAPKAVSAPKSVSTRCNSVE